MASILPPTSDCCSQCSGQSVTIIDVTGFLAGNGPPENVVTGTALGVLYTDLLTGTKYTFTGTVGTKIGWV